MRRAPLLLLLLLILPVLALAADEIPEGRLPQHVVPEHYDLTLTIVPESESFSGETRIRVRVSEAVDHIWLHARNMDMQETSITLENGETLTVDYEQLNEFGVSKLSLPREIAPQTVTLNFSYTAPFDGELRGLYKVEEGDESYAFTQFEAIDARGAFPSFDEPAFKTPFDIAVIVREDHVAIGNMPVVSEAKIGDGMKKVTYQTTPKLSTYLIAFAVGPLEVVDGGAFPPTEVRDYEVPFNGIAVKGKGDQFGYSLENTRGILEALEAYFGIPYPYPKLDVIAVPDFSAGAMENVGAITFRETLLLFDENASAQQKLNYAVVMAHELGHMWFGDLVTMPWWDDIWLNEAFATWIAYKAVYDWDPETRGDVLLLRYSMGAMPQDALGAARQIREPINTVNDISNAFDGITYRKGGGVLSMFEQYLGEENFRKGVQLHIERNAEGSADVNDFMKALSDASGQDITSAFSSFLFQSGVPNIDVSVSCVADNAIARIEQSRYLPLGSKADADRTWEIPVCMRYAVEGVEKEECAMVTRKTATLPLSESGCPDWVLPNANAAGYYRWSMPAEAYEALNEAPADTFNDRELMSIADSVNAAFDAGRLNMAEAVNAVRPLANANDPRVITKPMDMLIYMRNNLAASDADRARFEAVTRDMYADAFVRLAFSGRNDDNTQELRRNLVKFLALVGEDPVVRGELARLVTQALDHDGPFSDVIDTNVMRTAFIVAMQEGDAELFDELLARFRQSTDGTMRPILLAALGSARDPALLARGRNLLLDPDLRSNEYRTLLFAVAGVDEASTGARIAWDTRKLDSTWNWMQNNIDALTELMPTGHLSWIPASFGGFCSSEKAVELQAFFEPRVEGMRGGPRVLAQVIETVENCAALKAAQQGKARSYLADL